MPVFSNTQIIEVDTNSATLDYFRTGDAKQNAFADLFGHQKLGVDDQIDQTDERNFSNESLQMEIFIDHFTFL